MLMLPAPLLSCPALHNNPQLQVGQALQAVTEGAGDDEDLRAAAAAATGAFAKHCRCVGTLLRQPCFIGCGDRTMCSGAGCKQLLSVAPFPV